MGRPLNKRYFGPPTAGGNELRVTFWDGLAAADGWIVKQLASKEFRVTDGTTTKDCYLTKDGTMPNADKEMTISVKLDDTSVAQVVKIAGRKVTLDTGVSIPWNFDTALDDGAVQAEDAGDSTDMSGEDDWTP